MKSLLFIYCDELAYLDELRSKSVTLLPVELAPPSLLYDASSVVMLFRVVVVLMLVVVVLV